MTEQLALRFPDGTKGRIRALAQDGESMTGVILRALAVLEGHGAIDSAEPEQPHDARLEAIERRLEALEARMTPDDDGVVDYHPIVKQGALRMQAEGRAPAEIRKAIEQACGRSPDPKHLARTLRRWAE